ncbi:MAG: glycosyltransferase [Candidatus Staskawiczbacteria bacterium]|nr:glycosyltransferase [Candidatus Staskawiczbacteria bacterium]
MLSIIIPALNEEKYLPLLLASIKEQDFSDYEIILADAGSTDKTLEIAKRYNCKIVPGGLPAKGRNEGEKVAKGELLFFVDADTILPGNFFKKTLAEFVRHKLEVASFCLAPLSKSKISSFLLNFFYNYPIILLERILPHAAMGIIVKKNLFEKLGGFDEDVKLAEDHYLARQAVKLFKARFGIIKSAKLFISDRRFKTDGWVLTGIKFFLCELYMIFLGPVKSDIFNYRFDHYDKAEPK